MRELERLFRPDGEQDVHERRQSARIEPLRVLAKARRERELPLDRVEQDARLLLARQRGGGLDECEAKGTVELCQAPVDLRAPLLDDPMLTKTVEDGDAQRAVHRPGEPLRRRLQRPTLAVQQGVSGGRREPELGHLRADGSAGAFVGGLEAEHRGTHVGPTDQLVGGDRGPLEGRWKRQGLGRGVVARARLATEQHGQSQRGLDLEGVERSELSIDGDDELLLLAYLDVARESRPRAIAQQLETLLVQLLLCLEQPASRAEGDEVEIRLGHLRRDG